MTALGYKVRKFIGSAISSDLTLFAVTEMSTGTLTLSSTSPLMVKFSTTANLLSHLNVPMSPICLFCLFDQIILGKFRNWSN